MFGLFESHRDACSQHEMKYLSSSALPSKKENDSNTVPIVHLANANLPAPPSTRHTAPLLLLLVVADRVRDLENCPLI